MGGGMRKSAKAVQGGLTGQAAIYLGATIINAAVPFLLLPLLARWLGPADFGVVGVYVAMVNVLSVVVGLSTHGLISVVYYRDGPKAMPPQAGAALAIAGAVGVTVLLLTLAFRDSLAQQTGIASAWLWAVVAAAACQFVQYVVLTVFQTRQQPFHYAAMQIGFGLTLAALTILFVAGAGTGWVGRVLAQVLGGMLLASIGLAWLTRTGGISWNIRAWPVRAALEFGAPLVPHALAATAMASVDRLALSSTVGPAAVGHYFVAVQISSVWVVVATALNQAWLPWLYKRLASDDVASKREVVRVAYGVIALFLLGGIMLSSLAGFVIPIVAGPQYAPAVSILQFLALASAFNGLCFFMSGPLFYEGKTGTLSLITVMAATLQTILCFTLVQHYGALGVAGATFISFLAYFIAVWAASNRAHPLPWGDWLRRPRARAD